MDSGADVRRISREELFGLVAVRACHAAQPRRTLSFMDFRAEDQRIHVLGRTTTAAPKLPRRKPETFATLEASMFPVERRSYAFTRPEG
jgi:hypothetical protein